VDNSNQALVQTGAKRGFQKCREAVNADFASYEVVLSRFL
jgi:hypothetical protein